MIVKPVYRNSSRNYYIGILLLKMTKNEPFMIYDKLNGITKL